MKIGILALQGGFELHAQMLAILGVDTVYVRKPDQLVSCHGLIIPGGESTTLMKLMREGGLFESISDFAADKPVFGTCAGLIMLAMDSINDNLVTLNLIDLSVERNAYGRQIDSFIDSVEIRINGAIDSFEGVFIRAPKIVAVGEGIDILGTHSDDVVLAENDQVFVATFHPELTNDVRIHQYFVGKIRKSR
ncbi:TPA: pyridoxal 5'-phosphate synthase glutaminase subunit PdxT [Candidatus Poribacteria bacterium]|jgi:5'-phosphate synthase pdxT subunit|nr:pyridoxal 5'-phosphate synthase glutaminase subunit PdxT [Candidatus Poribacteria bacterium]HIA64871.1 pyridoxal 5'-phosphate synthase glutaminase subunit PdxT [Candidatus Poribacteria bacterium]HIB87653.1 pyridoxal 5'-phosphate synthase glutaminase subunit PdxT [Candidatus Poribacteria bacterium]HIB99373.1 pyridoxal 5'-phosphate synthase glutaminase subunit PdxT [Candidatus Poribacteria bacterium]HIC18835.1 pyridoxal 5'-phosphate synthase glutaminase subunit PdxT [Candidatus Poribacteria ba